MEHRPSNIRTGRARRRRTLALLLAGSALGGACDPGAGPPPHPRPNVLLITLDAVRADRLGAYGYRLETTPALDGLARKGVRFADASVAWPKTWPSMAALITGRYPTSNGVRLRPRRPLPAENVTLAEALRDAGYATGAVVTNVNLGRAFGFDQGFDRFVESWVDEALRQTGQPTFENAPGLVKRFTNASITTRQAIELLGELGARRPFFVWLHYIDPHGPYLPPPEYARLFTGARRAAPVRLEEVPPYQRQIDPETGETATDIAFYAAQYDREIRYVDDQLGLLFAMLAGRGLARNTLIVVTSDHGESLDENRYYLEHGNVPYQSNAAVPLIFALEGRLARRVVDAPVGVIDVYPTILDLAGAPPQPGVQGTSLVPLLEGSRDGGPAFVFVESGHVEPTQLSVRRGPWKLVHLRSPRDRIWLARREVELYDLSRDPHERDDARAEYPGVAAELEAALAAWLRDTPRFAGGGRTDPLQLDPAGREMLRDLGYLE
jgi:arylsulfatase A-like enzyme